MKIAPRKFLDTLSQEGRQAPDGLYFDLDDRDRMSLARCKERRHDHSLRIDAMARTVHAWLEGQGFDDDEVKNDCDRLGEGPRIPYRHSERDSDRES